MQFCENGLQTEPQLSKLEPGMLEMWQKAVPRKDRLLSIDDAICEKHFEESCIERQIFLRDQDGSVVQVIERKRPHLKPGSIPSIFPNCPFYLTKKNSRRKPPASRKQCTSLLPEQCSRDSLAQCSSEATEFCFNALPVLSSGALPLPCSSALSMQFSSALPQEVSYALLCDQLENIKRPDSWWTVSSCMEYIICVKWNKEYKAERKVVVTENLSAKIFLKDREIPGLSICLKSQDCLNQLLETVDKSLICLAADTGIDCQGHIGPSFSSTKQPMFCKKCLLSRKNLKRNARTHLSAKKMKMAVKAKNTLRRNSRLIAKVENMKQDLFRLQAECSKASEKVLDEAIKCLPPLQQEAIKACFAASKLKSIKSIRYSEQWMYECLLLNIKNRNVYEHLRSKQILILPSTQTLRKCIKSIKGAFGFQNSVFEAMKIKAASMDNCDKRGVILLDEMKLTEGLEFNSKTACVDGFVNLGPFTDPLQCSTKGDHALVLMFQPFRGTWVQALACFLSKSAASGGVLHQIVIECVILLECSGFYVDAITSDGATWNRKMWDRFGINEDNVSCQHVYDENRRLWFISDFPHLIKCVRNTISSKKEMMTHIGPIKTSYWEAILEMDNPKGFNLKVCPGLTYDVIYPKPFQKMNVARAFRFFGKSVVAAMELYKDVNLNLREAEPCIRIVKIFQDAIQAMNARTPYASLKPNSPELKAIETLLDFITKWEAFAKANDYAFISDSTCFGLKVTLKATLEIHHFLTTECNYQYLMTARLNQDALERFFSMMRGAGGSNDHPDPHTFLQLYRLVSTYSLIKPPKGSNVAGEEILGSLLELKDAQERECKKDWEVILDKILDLGLTDALTHHPELVPFDHDYLVCTTDNRVTAYVSGYVSRRVQRFTKCISCKVLLVDPSGSSLPRNILITMKSAGGLIYPSDSLYRLISHIEACVLSLMAERSVSYDILYQLMLKLEDGPPIPMIGCTEHQGPLTESMLRFYLVTRIHFICHQENRNASYSSNKTKMHRKLSKL